MSSVLFARSTSVTPLEPGSFAANLGQEWTIGPVPNGGYVMSTMLRAVAELTDHADPLTATAHFLSPTAIGEVVIATETIKAGRSVSTFEASLTQGGRERVRMLATFGSLAGREGPDGRFLEPPELSGPLVSDRSSLMGSFPTNFNFAIPEHMAGGLTGNPSGTMEMAGTIAFVDGGDFDLISLATVADGFPPTAFNLGHVAWTPTLELTVHFWNHPASGPLTASLSAGALVGGFHDESGDIWDSTGTLVARSRQLALVL